MVLQSNNKLLIFREWVKFPTLPDSNIETMNSGVWDKRQEEEWGGSNECSLKSSTNENLH